jgi:hypothetical protein
MVLAIKASRKANLIKWLLLDFVQINSTLKLELLLFLSCKIFYAN